MNIHLPFMHVKNYLNTVKTVICDLQLDLDKKVAYDRRSLNTMSICIDKMFGADWNMVAYDRGSFNSGGR